MEREPSQVNAPFIRLVKEGTPRLPNQRRNTRPLLSDDVLRCARDWQFLFDVGTGYSIFPIDFQLTFINWTTKFNGKSRSTSRAAQSQSSILFLVAVVMRFT